MEDYNLDKLIKLSNINIEGDDADSIKESVVNILNWCKELDKVDTTGVEPLFSIFDMLDKGMENFREDTVSDGNYQAQVIKNAPDKEDVFICVPKVIE